MIVPDAWPYIEAGSSGLFEPLAAATIGAPCTAACAIENSGEQVYSLQSVGRRVFRHIQDHMLIIVGGVIVSIAVVIISRMRVPGGVNAGALGWMSEQWLAEHRASQSV